VVEKYKHTLKEPARALRKSMTDAEQALWGKIRQKQVHGLQFYRQKPLLSFIVDFYCPKAKLVIELDGSQHFEPEHQIKDQARDAQLAALGLRVLRFDNRQVLKEMDAVLAVIWREVGVVADEKEIPPGPPFFKGGKVKLYVTLWTESPLCPPIEHNISPPLKKGDLGGFKGIQGDFIKGEAIAAWMSADKK